MSEVVQTEVDWKAVFAEIKSGIRPKHEICQRYGISRAELDAKQLSQVVGYGSLTPNSGHHPTRYVSVVMSDEEMSSQPPARSMAVVRSHLHLTRSIQIRLAMLIEGYDQLTETMTTENEFGLPEVDAKKWVQAAVMLEGISKIAERLIKTEQSTFGSAGLVSPVSVAGSYAPTAASKEDDAATSEQNASLAYLQMMNGGG